MSGYVQIKDLPVVSVINPTDQFVLQRTDGNLYKILGSSLITNITNITISTPPNNYTNLKLWYQPSGLIHHTSPSNLYAGWRDDSGNSKDLAGTGGPNCLWGGSLNGIPVASFDQVNNGNNYFRGVNEGNPLYDVNAHSSYTIIMVAKSTRNTGGFYRDIGSYSGENMQAQNILQSIYVTFTDANNNTVQANIPGCDHDFIIAITFDATTGTLNLYKEGVNAIDVNPSYIPTTTFGGHYGFYSTFILGGAPANGFTDAPTGMTGRLPEYISYSDVKPLNVINNVCQYLANKFALTWITI